jgi:hypothetical protein
MENLDFKYWDFIEKNILKYHLDGNVLLCDILFRYLGDEEVSESDLNMINDCYPTKECVINALVEAQCELLREALTNYYKRTF